MDKLKNNRKKHEKRSFKNLVEHPSALDSFDRMMKAAKGKRMVVFLDYDGTLSPIVDDPNRAFMSDEIRAAV
ncbi:hypothetical protein C1H46_033770 [Malus baccata]|uniref:Trehalose 6-phosphate phosphatase n=1 Tax=Malus baccata TaxID=106549 RepID=A0A540L2G1_MALBA|nr:hypothetical protein C1H46_033770 [Malus baccata]